MPIRLRSIPSRAWHKTGHPRVGRGQFTRASAITLACLLAALAFAGCSSSVPRLAAVFSPTAPAAARTAAPGSSAVGAAFSPTGSLMDACFACTGTTLSDGRILIAGGYDSLNMSPASVELYDPKTGTFSSTGSTNAARGGPTVTLLSDGRVLIAGGYDSTNTSLASAELYDPKTGTFSPTGSMTAARGGRDGDLAFRRPRPDRRRRGQHEQAPRLSRAV
jgi:hypothetical protein